MRIMMGVMVGLVFFWAAILSIAASLSGRSFSLAPGETKTFTLDITSPVDAAEGAYDIPVTVTGAGGSSSATATYVVSGAVANQPPVATDDSATTDKSTPVTIPVLDNDYDPDGDPLRVLVVGNPGKGTVELNADDSITYTPGRKAKGSDSFYYTISDGKAMASATVQIAFTKGGGRGKGKKP